MSRLFSGTSEYLNIENGIIYTEPFTFACRFRTHNRAKDQNLMHTGNAASDDWHGIQIYGSSPFTIRAMSFDGGFSASTTTSGITDDVWHMVAGVWASNTSRIAYLDGVAASENTTSRIVTATSRFRIGTETYGTTGDFDGDIAETAIWNIDLSLAELKAFNAGYSPLFIRPQNLIAYWPLVRGLNDKVGGYNLTASGTVVSAHPRVINPSPLHSGFGTAAAPPAGIPIFRRRRAG